MTKIIDKKEFTEKVLNGSGLSIVRFCAAWSGPCQIMGPIYEDMSIHYKHAASFYMVDIDEVPELKIALGITELPTILFYKNAVIVDFVIGLMARKSLIEKIETVLKK